MSDDQMEFAWVEDGKTQDDKELVHLAIATGNVKIFDDGKGNARLQSDEQFTACGIKIPVGATLWPTDIRDINCSPCLEAQYGPHVEEFVRTTLKEPAVA